MILYRKYEEKDWKAICAIHDLARPHELLGSCDPRAFIPIEQDKEVEYRLVTPEESNFAAGLISVTSPIGRSLMGKSVGDGIEIVTPSGRKEYELRNLITIHDLED